MLTTLDELRAHGLIGDVDVELALTLGELAGEREPAVLLGAAFASAAIQAGHTCADLERLSSLAPADWGSEPVSGIRLPALDEWRSVLGRSALVSAEEFSRNEPRPLVLAGGRRLYLARYFEYEARLACALSERIGGTPAPLAARTFEASLERLFPGAAPGSEEKRRAAVVSLLSGLTVITGGPGTGKTTTVSKILYLLIEQALAGREAAPRIALLAPTGKAAQRLGEAIRTSSDELGGDPEVARHIPAAAATLHRALGYQPRTPTRFRRHEGNPLVEDVVVVDEASMVDLALMAKLVLAVKPGARLILLGDQDQLASVEAGSILADVCRGRRAGVSRSFARRAGGLGADFSEAPEERASLADSLVELRHSHRFAEGGGIAELSRAVNAGEAERALDVLAGAHDVTLEPLPEPAELGKVIGRLVADRLGNLARESPAGKLALLDGFRLLAAHRRGPYGVDALNALARRELARAGLIESSDEFFDGQPLIVTANDYEIDLYNGDVGVVGLAGAGENRPLTAFFPETSGVGPGAQNLRAVPIGRLPAHETAFAISVHKSQGSEFDEVALVLGDRPSPLFTRELVYTAVTRARRRVRIFCSPEVFGAAVRARVERASGLRERLWATL